jgi:hypothetical protein
MSLCASSRPSLGVEAFGADWGGTGVSGPADSGGEPAIPQTEALRSCSRLRA